MLRIDYECPQCGAPVVLDEADRLLTCGFCKTRLYMQPREYFRYCIMPSDPFLDIVLYVPYWRFRGMHFICKTGGISAKVIDKTFPAIKNIGFPSSLGIRPQSLKIRFARNKENSRFLQPGVNFDMTLAETRKLVTYEIFRIPGTRLIDLGGDFAEVPEVRLEIKEERIYYETFVADMLSVIYAPFYPRDGGIFDAITNQAMPGVTWEEIPDTVSGNLQIDFLPTICPNCGRDTVSGKDGCIMFCGNCASAWEIRGLEASRVTFAMAESKKMRNGPAVYLPFWRIKANIKGAALQSYADLVRFANIPRAIKPEWERHPFHLWIPAIKANPSVFLRSARQFTIVDPIVSADAFPHIFPLPVNLPLCDAIDSAKILIAELAAKKKEIFPRLADIELQVEDTLLVLVPFAETIHEYIQPDINYAIMKNALA
jgi:ribosomal protein S27AE